MAYMEEKPDWFDIKNYDGTHQYSAEDWLKALTIRAFYDIYHAHRFMKPTLCEPSPLFLLYEYYSMRSEYNKVIESIHEVAACIEKIENLHKEKPLTLNNHETMKLQLLTENNSEAKARMAKMLESSKMIASLLISDAMRLPKVKELNAVISHIQNQSPVKVLGKVDVISKVQSWQVLFEELDLEKLKNINADKRKQTNYSSHAFEHSLMLKVDLNQPMPELITAIKRIIAENKKEIFPINKVSFSRDEMRKLIQHRVLPYLDLSFYARVTGKRIKQKSYAYWLCSNPAYMKSEKEIRETCKVAEYATSTTYLSWLSNAINTDSEITT